MASTPMQVDPKALSVYIIHTPSGGAAGSPAKEGVHSAMKSARTYDLMAERATNLTAKGASFTAIFLCAPSPPNYRTCCLEGTRFVP